MHGFDEFGDFIDDNYYIKNNFEVEAESESPGLNSLIKEVTSSRYFPLLFVFLEKEKDSTQITNKQFFSYILDNFEKLNENEFHVINKNFFVRDYIDIMFKHVLDNHVLITQEKFIEYLEEDKKHFNHFKKDYQQQLITYYAFNSFDSINDEQWKLIFEPVYEYEYRHLFATSDFAPQKPVLNKTFWSYFTPQSHIVTSYLQHITQNNLHSSMSFMCEHFGDYVHNYLYKNDSKKEQPENTILEQHYIYHNPQHCNISTLNYAQLSQVLARIYKSIPDKDLTSKNNKDFYNSLENGIYYLFDYIVQIKPEDIRYFFEKRPKTLGYLLTDLENFSSKTLHVDFQNTFFQHVFEKNLDLLFKNNDSIKKIITGNPDINTPLQKFLKQHIELLPDDDKQHIIFNTVKNNVAKFNMPLLIEQLMIFSIDSLQQFSQNINIYLNIINDSYDCKTQFDEIKQSVNKSIINKKLTEKFKQDTPNKAKRIKI